MGLRDNKTFLSVDQAVTAQAVSTYSQNKGTPKAGINTSATPLFLHALVKTTLTDGGSNAGTNIDLVDATTEDLGTNLAVVKAAVLSFAQGAVAGTHKSDFIPGEAYPSLQQYWGVRFTPVTANLTGGTFDVWHSEQRELIQTMPASFTV